MTHQTPPPPGLMTEQLVTGFGGWLGISWMSKGASCWSTLSQPVMLQLQKMLLFCLVSVSNLITSVSKINSCSRSLTLTSHQSAGSLWPVWLCTFCSVVPLKMCLTTTNLYCSICIFCIYLFMYRCMYIRKQFRIWVPSFSVAMVINIYTCNKLRAMSSLIWR